MSKIRILVIHGPNLNLLGTREPEIYGKMTLAQINTMVTQAAEKADAEVRIFQSNSEGALVDSIQEAGNWAGGIVVNPGAYGHYSIALRDAIAAARLPTIEVHLSNVFGREDFRHELVVAPVCLGLICGLGWRGYVQAVQALAGILSE